MAANQDKFVGDMAQFTVGSTDYLCLTDWQMSQDVEIAVARCSGANGATVVKIPTTGTNTTFTFNVLAEDDWVTELNALAPGTTGAFEAHPAGDASGRIEMTATECVVRSRGLTVTVDGLAVMPVTIEINGTLTIQVAS